ncbi:MAG TPA: hypothetical protein VEJ45_00345 [Candidatus Acidoferrales bacterium]|nr:hypothetical protein [Candidatus Acidoferrales bacterium]
MFIPTVHFATTAMFLVRPVESWSFRSRAHYEAARRNMVARRFRTGGRPCLKRACRLIPWRGLVDTQPAVPGVGIE